VTAVNGALGDDPAKVNASPEDEGWFFKIKLTNKAELEQLMTEAKYQEFVKGL
jgi:glycine cleavage system H protein